MFLFLIGVVACATLKSTMMQTKREEIQKKERNGNVAECSFRSQLKTYEKKTI